MRHDAVEKSIESQFVLSQAPTLVAMTELSSPLSFTRLHNRGEFYGRTMKVPTADAFSIQVALAPMAAGELRIGGNPSTADLARACRISASRLTRTFARFEGVTPGRWRRLRGERQWDMGRMAN